MAPILQASLPYTPWSDSALRRMPGLQPVAAGEWLQIDDAYSAQLAEKARLINERPRDVLALDAGAQAAGEDLLLRVVEELRGVEGFTVAAGIVTRPDGVQVALDYAQPLLTLSQLTQEDFCILRLAKTDAIVFSIHTYQIRRENLTPDQAAALVKASIEAA